MVISVLLILAIVLFLVIYKKSVRVKMMTYFFLFYFLFIMLTFIWPVFLLNWRSTKNAKQGNGLLEVLCGSPWAAVKYKYPGQFTHGHMTPKIVGRIFKFAARYTDLKWELRNGDILAADRAAVIVANHQSALDILGTFVFWDVIDKMTVAAKKEFIYLWPIGITFYLCGVIFVDRRNAKGAYKELQTTANKLHETKTKIWIFPEGTRNKDIYKLLPFKKGAFSTAVEAQLPIIPVVFSPYHFMTKEREALLKRGPIIVECLEPVPTTGLTAEDVPALTERVRERMEAKYKQLSEEVLN